MPGLSFFLSFTVTAADKLGFEDCWWFSHTGLKLILGGVQSSQQHTAPLFTLKDVITERSTPFPDTNKTS